MKLATNPGPNPNGGSAADILALIQGMSSSPVQSSDSRQEGSVYFGSHGRSTEIPITQTRYAPNRRGNAAIPEYEGTRGRPYKAQTGTRPGVELQDDVRGEGEARNTIYSWVGSDQYDKWGDRLVQLDLIDEKDKRNVNVLNDVWQDVMDHAVRLQAAGKRLTPYQVLELMVGSGYGGHSGGGSGGFTGSRSSTSTSVDLTDPMTAKAIVNDALSRYLGRSANDSEIKALTASINSAERSNPSVTNSTTSYQDGVAVSESSTTSGGVTNAGRQQIVADDAMARPEYGAYQSASTYFNALTQAINSPV